MGNELFTVKNVKDLWIIKPTGILDLYNSSDFKEKVKNEYINQGKVNLIIDLSSVEYMDSSALGVLVGLQRSCRLNGGTLVLCGLNDNLMRIFQITSLVSVFRIFPNVEDAIKALLEEGKS
ncbi:STAS domain-containing protein [Pseudothermotoga thermarum]|uniref:Anti-sigma factor antagonist n=1 Tax=Pseudothermotoga thermarum DSM 5069 TaxID=688269 RepID=F7YV01_9THEM|nr:STAS domain-containing protein [Pseudothermotoga thermarum]AEH50285.1 anti-sigma-factor antagonist [Pseudothermotoga thermarum DSM 5069]